MKLTTSLSNLFEQGELEQIERLSKNNVVPKFALIRILEHREKSTRPNQALLSDVNYSYKRTFYDGRASELVFLINLLTEKEEANDPAGTGTAG